MTQRKVGELIADFSIYPRVSVDSQHVGYMKAALQAGAAMPPIVACAKSLRIVDGVHRSRAYLSLYGADYTVDVIEKKYKTEADIFEDAIRLNANHGRALSRYDRAHCILVAEKLNLTLDATAQALSMTAKTLTELSVTRMGMTTPIHGKSERTPLKRTIAHMAGQSLTAEQVETNKHLSGMNQMFYVNQLVMLIENDLLDGSNVEMVKRLKYLGTLIRQVKQVAA